jgi:hypothetical protein
LTAIHGNLAAMAKQKNVAEGTKSGRFVLGSDRFAKISEVEGIRLTPAMKNAPAMREAKASRRKNTAARLFAAMEKNGRPLKD